MNIFGKFNADIIRDKTTNTYRGIFEFEQCACEVFGAGWKEFRENEPGHWNRDPAEKVFQI